MIPQNLDEIWKLEVYYDNLRWSSEKGLEEMDHDSLEKLRFAISETIDSLQDWLHRKESQESKQGIERVKRKLLDFRWNIVVELQKRQHKWNLFERINALINPKPRDGRIPPPDYGLQEPLKGSDFHKGISRIFAPRAKGSVQS